MCSWLTNSSLRLIGRDAPGVGRSNSEQKRRYLFPRESNMSYNLPDGCTDYDCDPWPRFGEKEIEDDIMVSCEGCGRLFHPDELQAVPAVDADIQWCEHCRSACECGHIKGIHSQGANWGCEECDCMAHNDPPVPPKVIAAAKGIYMSDRFRQQLRKERG